MKPTEPFLELPDNDDDLSTEKLDLQVQKAQEQLLSLKRQQDLIEKQKRELEELSRKQDQLQQGKSEMIEKFTRATVVLDREMFEAQKRVELLREIQESFTQHLDVLESIDSKHWENADFNRELSKALSAVDDARGEYTKSLPKIQPDERVEAGGMEETHYADNGEHNFLYWLKAGFAFTLPLVVLAILGLLILLVR